MSGVNNDFYVGYSQNDFYYMGAENTGTASYIKPIPVEFTDDRCSKFGNNKTISPDDRNQLITDISNNLAIHIETISQGITTTPQSSSKFNTGTGNVSVTVTSTNGVNTGTSNMNVGNWNMSYDTANNGRPYGKLTANINMTDKPVSIKDANGNTRYLMPTTANPRCYYNPNCTRNHNYYTGGCQTVTHKQADGTTYCKCKCSGGIKLNTTSLPHSHCEEINITDKSNQQLTPLLANSSIKSIKLNITPSEWNKGITVDPNTGNVTVAPNLNHADLCEKIADYYIALCQNKVKAEQIRSDIGKSLGSTQMKNDVHVYYNKEYTQVLNIGLGILGLGAGLFLMTRTVNPANVI